MKRETDWEERLNAYLDDVRELPHKYGSHDCGLFVSGAVAAMTGDDFLGDFRGTYSTEKGAARQLKRRGAGDLASTLTERLGEPVGPAFAQRGDVVMHEGCAGLCVGSTAFFVGEEREGAAIVGVGLVSLDRSKWQMAWRVPY